MKKLLFLALLLPSLAFAGDKTVFIQYGGPNLGGITTSLVPNTDNTYDLGSTDKEWKDLWVDGIAHTDAIDADNVDITTITDTNIPYISAAGFTDSPLSTDGTNITNSGDLANTGAITETGNAVPNAADGLDFFSTTTSEELRGVLSDETGTGVAVFADTPTLVAPVLGAATATTIDTGQGANELYDMDQNVLTTSSPTFGGINITGSQLAKKTNVSDANYGTSAFTTDYFVSWTSLSAARTAVISTEDVESGTVTQPRVMIFKDETGNAGSFPITITLESGGTIDGATSYVINQPYQSVSIYLNGTNGFVF